MLTQRIMDSEINNIGGTHFEISVNGGIVTKSKPIPEAKDRWTFNLNFESDLRELVRMTRH